MFQDVIIKPVLDQEGFFSHIELHQGNNVLKLSLASTDLNIKKPLWKWRNLKRVLDSIDVSKFGPKDATVEALIETWQESKEESKEEK